MRRNLYDRQRDNDEEDKDDVEQPPARVRVLENDMD